MNGDWKKYSLEDVCEKIYSGGTPSTRHSDYWNGDLKWLSSKYYRSTIDATLETVSKRVQDIETDNLREYLTNYQKERQSGKVTIDNIRRILSSFFSWLEDEDYILEKPCPQDT